MTIFYISPTGSGSHNGSSASNAGTIYDLPRLIAAAGPGDEVRLLADRGAYNITRQLTITAGGGAGAPITIRGVNSAGEPMKANIVGTRASDWEPGRAQGNTLFRLVSGANHLQFTDLATKNFGNGVFRLGDNISDIAIKRVAATNVMRFIENYRSGAATSATVSGLTVEDVTIAGYSADAIRVRYNSHDIVIRNVVGDSMRQPGGNFIHGVNLRDTAHDVLLENVTMKNNYGSASSSTYWNGDGFLAEGGTYNLTFRDTMSSGNTDAGYDIKANNVTMIRAQASGNNKNFRFWGDNVRVTDSVSTNPTHWGGSASSAHFHSAGNKVATVTLDNFRYSGAGRVFDLLNAATIRLVNMAMPPSNLVRLGDGSTLRMLTNVAAALTANEKTITDSLASGSDTEVLVGSGGDDTYLVKSAGDIPAEVAGGGTDLVNTTLGTYKLGAHIENLSYVGSANFTGTGNGLNNTVTGAAGADGLHGSSGDDQLNGGVGSDRLWGDSGNDQLNGGVGSDRLSGGTGDDVLTGGEGADKYVFNRGGGKDTIYNQDSGGADRLVFGAGITEDQLWFGKSGSDLLVTLRGTGNADSVRVKDWYSGSGNRLSNVQTSDGAVLDASRVQQMVQAMAAFSTSSGTPTSLSSSEQNTVENVIAANWQNNS